MSKMLMLILITIMRPWISLFGLLKKEAWSGDWTEKEPLKFVCLF